MNEPIGVSISGGADSAILSYILMKYNPGPIHFYTLATEQKQYRTLFGAANVINKCVELTGNHNVFFHVEFTSEKQSRDNLLLMLRSKTMDVVKRIYLATTSIPPREELQLFKNQINDDMYSRRNPDIIKPVYSNDKLLYDPFLNINKKDIRQLYESQGVIYSLFPVTRSCEALDLHEGHCGKCWWCEERKWAFDHT